MNRRALALSLIALLSGAALSGCLGLFGDEEQAPEEDVNEAAKKFVDNRTQEQLLSRIAPKPSNYTMPMQQELPPVVVYFNGTVDSSAAAAYSDRNDRGGNDYNTVRVATDIGQYLPQGQPAEIRLTLHYTSTLANSAKLDIFVNVPGNHTDWNPSNNDEFNWKASIQRTVLNTVGVPGEKAEVGVQVSNGRIAPGQSLPFSLRMEFTYVKDVLAPGLPYAFTVPENATGIIVTSEKAGGPEHLKSKFIVVGPADELVSFVDFNDINIPTESVFINTPTPGEYVFYAYYMDGGFLRLRADSPVENREVRTLAMAREFVVDEPGAAPGVAERDWLHDGTVVSPGSPGSEKTFTVDGKFPLDIRAFIGNPESGAGHTLMSDVKIFSPKGLVSHLQRVLRADDERGSLGYTNDHWNSAFNPANLAKGAYRVEIVNNSPDAPVGHVIVTYTR